MSIIFCIISRLKRDEQTDTYVHFEQTATLREIVTTIDSPYVFFYTKYPTPRLGEHAQNVFFRLAPSHRSRHALFGLLHGTRWFANGTPDY